MVKKETAQTQKIVGEIQKNWVSQIKYLGPIAFSRDDKQEAQTSLSWWG